MCPILDKLRPRFDHFSLVAPIYEQVISNVNLEMLQSLLALEPTTRLLDAGGGTGRVSALLSQQVERVVLTDVSWGMLLLARGKDGLQPAHAHAERLPFPSNSFDRILMVDAFHHVCDQGQTAAEMLRVLAPGGRIVVEEPDIRSFKVKLVAVAEKLALMRSRFLNPTRMSRIFEACGGRVSVHTDPNDAFNVWLVVEQR